MAVATSNAGSRRTVPLSTMCDAICHRGPDGSGEWWSDDKRVGLAHRRLAIIDLSPGASQPMHAIGRTLHIVFNGEIYNYSELREELRGLGHQFATASDTEVILEAYREWGDDCVRRLNGMFAFALFDAPRRRLLVARDRAGEKPLFYSHGNAELRLASELKALMADDAAPRVVDMRAFEEYLAFGYVAAPRCMLRGVRKLPAGHYMVYDVDRNALVVTQYWSLPTFDGRRVPEDELVHELDALLEDSVRRQLVADVPVGVLLSGGIDSSLVTAMASRVAKRVRTFTVTFPEHAEYNEGPYAQLVASHFGTEHCELVTEPATVDLIPALARQFDEPMADSSMVPTYLVSRLIRQHATVALGGDGGDELFGGYMHYSRLQAQEGLHSRVPRLMRQAAGSVAGRLPVGTRGRNYVVSLMGSRRDHVAQQGAYFDPYARRRLLAPQAKDALGSEARPERDRAALVDETRSTVQSATALDFSTYLVDDILAKVDRASMLTSLEVRAPFLDYRIVEFAFSRLPDDLRAAAGMRKILPRRLAAKLLPSTLDLSRKQGFSLPLASWFRGPWGTYLEGVLQDAPSSLFNTAAVASLIEGQRRGRSNTQRIFALAMFELWRRTYHVALPF